MNLIVDARWLIGRALLCVALVIMPRSLHRAYLERGVASWRRVARTGAYATEDLWLYRRPHDARYGPLEWRRRDP